MSACRVCGRNCGPEEVLPVHLGGGCRQCNGSPACSRCGHARRHHRGAFGATSPGCAAQTPVGTGLAIARCGCSGYTTSADAYREDPGLVDIQLPRLRRPGEDPHPGSGAVLPPARDLFDAGDRRAPTRPVAWRPPS